MSTDGRVLPLRCHAPGTAIKRSAVLPVVGVFLAASGLIFLAACVAVLAAPPRAASSVPATPAMAARWTLPAPGRHGRDVWSIESTSAVSIHGGRSGPDMYMAPGMTQASSAALRKRAESCSVAGSRSNADDLVTPVDLRCDLMAMAASQRRARFVYVGPR